MDLFVGPRAATKIGTGCMLALLASPICADELSLVEAFQQADRPTPQATSRISYELDDCIFQRTIVNLGYCQLVGQGEGDRTIITYIDLREVEAISTSEVRGNFVMSFQLDFGGPGSLFVWTDRFLNGSEGAFERYSERRSTALNEAELNSVLSFSRCEDASSGLQKDPQLAIVTDTEPEGWQRLIDLAKECRATNPFEFSGR